jgi:hypothetical protein
MATLPIPFPQKMGRPRKELDVQRVLALRARGLSWREIAKRLGISVGTAFRASGSCTDGGERKSKDKRNPRYRLSYRRYLDYLLRVWNLPAEKYEEMIAAQDGKCFLCLTPIPKTSTGRLLVDHDHETGAMRRALCHSCNVGLGMFYDKPELLRKAAEYVEEFKRQPATVKKCSKSALGGNGIAS